MFSARMGFESTSVTPLVGNQYITTFSSTDGTGGKINYLPGPNNYDYLVTNYSLGMSKLDSTGNLVFQQFGSVYNSITNLDINGAIANTINDFFVDSNENIYASGSFSDLVNSKGGVVGTKYNSGGTVVGTICFDTTIDLGSPSTGIAIVGYNNNTYMLTSSNTSSTTDANAVNFLCRFQTTGNSFSYVNQRHVFPTTTIVTNLSIDIVNNTILVSGTNNDGVHPTQIYNGTFDLINTSTNNTILVQSSNTTSYTSGPIVSDGSYYYQLCFRQIGSINVSVVTKIDKTTGILAYSKKITLPSISVAINLSDICLDNSNHIYVCGSSNNQAYIGKFNTSDFSIVWQKTISSVYGGYPYRVYSLGNISYSNNYIYFTLNYTNPYSPNTQYSSYVKIKSDGSLADGTYATYYVFANVAATTSTLNSDNISTFTYTPTTTSYGGYNAYVGTGSTFYAVTTTALP